MQEAAAGDTVTKPIYTVAGVDSMTNFDTNVHANHADAVDVWVMPSITTRE